MGIEVTGVSKSFGAQKVLDNLSLSIPDGKITAIVGPSGVGKSVLLKLILGIYEVDSGSISIFGEDMTIASSEEEKTSIRKNCGVLIQSAALLDSLTIYDNIAFPVREHLSLKEDQVYQKVWSIIEDLSLKKVANLMPQQVSLSVRKRVGMARAMILDPKVLLVDEPNTGLDPQHGQEVYDLIKSCQARCGFTGVVISHEIPEVFQVSDRVAMIFQGRIFAEGTPEEIIAHQDPYIKQFLKGSIHGPIRIH